LAESLCKTCGPGKTSQSSRHLLGISRRSSPENATRRTNENQYQPEPRQNSRIKEKLAEASAFLQGLISAAEQLTNPQRWELILLRIFERFIQPKLENTVLPTPATG